MSLKREAQESAAELLEFFAGDAAYVAHVHTLERYAGELRRECSDQATTIAALEKSKAALEQQIVAMRKNITALTASQAELQKSARYYADACEEHKAEAALWRVEADKDVRADLPAMPPRTLRRLFREHGLPDMPAKWAPQLFLERLQIRDAPVPEHILKERRKQLERVLFEQMPHIGERILSYTKAPLPHQMMILQSGVMPQYTADDYAMMGMIVKYAGEKGIPVYVCPELADVDQTSGHRFHLHQHFRKLIEKYPVSLQSIRCPDWRAVGVGWHAHVPTLFRTYWQYLCAETRTVLWFLAQQAQDRGVPCPT